MTVKIVPPMQPPLPSPEPPQRKRKADATVPLMDSKTELNTAADTQKFMSAPPAPAKKQKSSVKQPNAVRGRRKSRWKLKFHHQALPPEYLKHYRQQEKKRRLSENRKLADGAALCKPAAVSGRSEEIAELARIPEANEDSSPLEGRPPSFPPPDAQHVENDPRWPGFLAESFPNLNIDLSQNKAFIENLLSNQIEINRVDRGGLKTGPAPTPKPAKQRKSKNIPSSGKIMNYSDLPYMGEITLDGVKPRRGRKPKKADICHLIYKNYGQVFPGAPPPGPDILPKSLISPRAAFATRRKRQAVPPPVSPLPTVTGLLNHSEVQNRIINSLLERRLTQKVREKPEIGHKTGEVGEEPLNLCLKDLQSLKIKLSRKHGNIYETKPQEGDLLIKKEVIDVDSEESSTEDGDITPFNLVTTELRESDDDDNATLGELGSEFGAERSPEIDEGEPAAPPDPMMFWPPSNYFYPPMPIPDMYYPQIDPKASLSDRKPKSPKKTPNKRLMSKTTSNSNALAKRKRSAIFIPPLPAENTTNPANEVSICKFKFTGGAKPSLQEKKMLSVDSGGNFRYYSGTGDKSMRGYEYFPRESLQQCQDNTGCSPSGVFLTASALGSGEKIPEDIGHSGFFDPSFPLQLTSVKSESSHIDKKRKMNSLYAVPGDQTDSLDESDSETSNGASSSMSHRDNSHDGDLARGQARRTRKSLAREKLEQTFKEKGFLIQTQQLESAEGATYCKFRQLRKFTRYLFRSWKDYLPGNVRDINEGVANAETPALSPVENS